MGIALFSYDGKLCWGFNADWDLMPDLHDFVEAIETSFGELVAAAGGVGGLLHALLYCRSLAIMDGPKPFHDDRLGQRELAGVVAGQVVADLPLAV